MATSIYLGMPPETIKNWIIAEAERKQQEMLKTPLHFTANEDNSSVSLAYWDDLQCIYIDSWSWYEFEYSMTGEDDDWFDYTIGQVIELNKDETVYFRAKRGDVDGNPNLNGFAHYDDGVNCIGKLHKFKMEGSIKANGNIQFLLENTGTKMDVPAYCYYRMFEHCTSLTQAPKLPATTLADECYSYMFQFCKSLNNINVNFSAWNPSNATTGWLYNVSPTGTFTCPEALPEERGSKYIPDGWTIIRK